MSPPRGPRAAAVADAPPFLPDPDLIEHAEGNVRERERYRAHARRSRAESQRRWLAEHPEQPLPRPPGEPPPPSEADPALIE